MQEFTFKSINLKEKSVKKLVLAALLSSAFSAFAGGYFSATSKYNYDGWACDPGTPNYAGWVHFWRDDGKFLGALPANGQREPAVAANCGGGDSGAHGFSGAISFPSDYLDNKNHVVRAYFIRQDGSTNIELFNSVNVMFDGGAPPPPPPPPVVPTTQTGCELQQPSREWVLTASGNHCTRAGGSLGITVDRTWTYLTSLPIGYILETCSSDIPAGWAAVGSMQLNYKCGTGSVSVFTPQYYAGYTIKKVY